MEIEQKASENGKLEDNPAESNSEGFHGFTNDNTVKTPPKLVNPSKTRSRSRTPQSVNGNAEKPKKESKKLSLKKVEEQNNGSEEKILKNGTDNGEHKEISNVPKISQEQSLPEVDKVVVEAEKIVEAEKAIVEVETTAQKIADNVEMDPLVLGMDEDHPELQFDENSDRESGQNSPVLRCRTRRSLTRNIPTPKTPKSVESESEKNSTSAEPTTDPALETDEKNNPENLNDTNDSIDIGEVSTEVEVGSDATRVDFIANASNSTLNSDDSFFSDIRQKSLRGLTPRRAIRPLSGDYLKKAIKNSQNKSNLNLAEHDMSDRIGIKRKSRSITPEERKRFKQESGIISYLSSPLNILKNKFKSSEQDSTPKLTAYKDRNNDIHEEKNLEIVPYEPMQDKRSWCSLM